MARIQIPKSFLTSFTLLSSLSIEEARDIAGFINNVPIGTGANTFEKEFISKYKQWAGSVLPSTLFSLATFKGTDYHHISASEIIENLVGSYSKLAEQSDASILERLKINLEEIFESLDNLASTFKAFRLMSENNRTFTGSNIVSDIRLVFNNDLKDAHRTALVVHQLKLTTEENNESREYFFSLDSSDLIKLKDQINRAEEKDKIIRKQYEDVIDFITITD